MTSISSRVTSHNQLEEQLSQSMSTSTMVPNERQSVISTHRSSGGSKTYCFINPAAYAESSSYDFDSISENNEFFDIDKSPSFTRVTRLELSPEEKQKRKEAYEKWLMNKNARDREMKRQKREAEQEEKLRKMEELEAKRAKNDEKIREWMAKKDLEAREKMNRLNNLRKRASETNLRKPSKELKKAIDFKQWLEMKNEEYRAQKRLETERKHLQRDYQKCRESTSAEIYNKWKESSKSTPKPVPFNRGLESLRGSTTKIFVNPIEWKNLVD